MGRTRSNRPGAGPSGADRAAVLRAATGRSNTAIATELGVSKPTVGKWRERFARLRSGGLLDEPRPGAPRKIGDEQVAALVDRTLAAVPDGARHGSLRSMARASGLSVATVGRVRRAFGLQPHRGETFKLSTDPLFAAKLRDIVGLYLAPPDRALVLGVDESWAAERTDQVQALTRPHAAAAALAAGPGGAADPRLRPPRRHEPVRGPERAGGNGDRRMLPPPPRCRVAAVPRRGRRQHPF
jgi:transposase